jgi:hypothetical protein
VTGRDGRLKVERKRGGFKYQDAGLAALSMLKRTVPARNQLTSALIIRDLDPSFLPVLLNPSRLLTQVNLKEVTK